MNSKKIGAIFVLFIWGLLNFVPYHARSESASQNLKDAINAKAKELQEINQKILQNQKELEETAGKGKTLQKEIKKIDVTLGQLNLGIRSSEITIDKLNLEIESLNIDINDAQAQIDIKKEGIGALLKELQRKDDETLLIALLKNKTISRSLWEIEAANNINQGLSEEISNLVILNNELSGKLDQTSQKRKAVVSENLNLKNKRTITAGEKTERQTLLKETKNQEKIYQEQIAALKKMQDEVSDEIDKIETELRKNIDPTLLPIARPGALEWPVTLIGQNGLGRLTQKYGEVSYLYGGKPHNGIDIGAPVGTPIYAAEKGRVIEVGDQDKYCYKGAYGKFIVIEHENNLTTLYAHFSLQSVKKGESVERGQIIGYVGKTGYATGPHLHFTVYASQTYINKPSKACGPIMPLGGTLDPQKYL